MNNQILLNGITIEQLAEAISKILKTTNEVVSTTDNDYLTREQVCALLSINKTTLWKHTKSGKLLSYGLGNRIYYSKKEVLNAITPINHE